MTSSRAPDRKSPPGPVKIHRFEKKPPLRGASGSGGHEDAGFARPTLPELPAAPQAGHAEELPAHARPTLPEFPLQPVREAVIAVGPLQELPRLKEPGSPARGTPAVPAAAPRASPPSGMVSERLATARSLFGQGQLTQARGILEKLVARGVGGAGAYSLLGTIYMAQGSLERALECFEEALARDAEDLTARLHRGEVRLQKGDLLLAQQDLQHVLELGTAGSPLIEQARRLLRQLEEQRSRRRR
jgi:cytochrome c-type biogenesis protein CcmH/NrfG